MEELVRRLFQELHVMSGILGIAVGRARSLCMAFACRGVQLPRAFATVASQDGMVCGRRTSPARAKHGACPGGWSLSAGTESGKGLLVDSVDAAQDNQNPRQGQLVRPASTHGR